MGWDNPRDPRPKGSQKGTVRRDHQRSSLNFSSHAGASTHGGCLMTLMMLPFVLALALIRREAWRPPAPPGTSYDGAQPRPSELYYDTQGARFHDPGCSARPFPAVPHPGRNCDGTEITAVEDGIA